MGPFRGISTISSWSLPILDYLHRLGKSPPRHGRQQPASQAKDFRRLHIRPQPHPIRGPQQMDVVGTVQTIPASLNPNLVLQGQELAVLLEEVLGGLR